MYSNMASACSPLPAKSPLTTASLHWPRHLRTLLHEGAQGRSLLTWSDSVPKCCHFVNEVEPYIDLNLAALNCLGNVDVTWQGHLQWTNCHSPMFSLWIVSPHSNPFLIFTPVWRLCYIYDNWVLAQWATRFIACIDYSRTFCSAYRGIATTL